MIDITEQFKKTESTVYIATVEKEGIVFKISESNIKTLEDLINYRCERGYTLINVKKDLIVKYSIK